MPDESREKDVLSRISPGSSHAEGKSVYELKAHPENVHWGYFSAAVKPVIKINSDDIVVIEDVPRIDPEIVQHSGEPSISK